MNNAATMERPAGCGTPPVGVEIVSRVRGRVVPGALTVLASALLLFSLKLPLWQIRFEAPQYRDEEALCIRVHPNALRGDLRELATLDQYIGVHVPARLPQFSWLPTALIVGAALGLLTVAFKGGLRARCLIGVSCALALALAVAALQAMAQIHDIGHKRDQKTVLAGIKDFTPPFLGTSRIAQFTVSSRFGSGAWLIGTALVLQLSAARCSRQQGPGALKRALLGSETHSCRAPHL